MTIAVESRRPLLPASSDVRSADAVRTVAACAANATVAVAAGSWPHASAAAVRGSAAVAADIVAVAESVAVVTIVAAVSVAIGTAGIAAFVTVAVRRQRLPVDAADAFRYLAIALREPKQKAPINIQRSPRPNHWNTR